MISEVRGHGAWHRAETYSRKSKRSHRAIHSNIPFWRGKKKFLEMTLEDFTLSHASVKTARYQDSKQRIEESNHFPEFSKLTFHHREMKHLPQKTEWCIIVFLLIHYNTFCKDQSWYTNWYWNILTVKSGKHKTKGEFEIDPVIRIWV